MSGALNRPLFAALATASLLLCESGPLPAAQPEVAGPVFPLKPSANRRYLVDQNGRPFLMVGDSPQGLIGNLSTRQAGTFMANRQRHGVNTLWINLLCASYTACHADGTTYDGIKPFTTGTDLGNYDITTPNEEYFARVDAMLAVAASHHMVVVLDPIETGSWLDVLRSNGLAKAYAYGQFLGTRYKDTPNIIWMHGNDFQSWRTATDNQLVKAVARGIRDTDPNHIQTAELDYLVSATLDDEVFNTIANLNAVYTYRPTYAKLLTEYQRSNYRVTFMVEANYEFEHNGGTDGGSLPNLRKQEYWTMLSGATGQLYGSAYSWRLDGDWQHNLNTPGIEQFGLMRELFTSRKWYELVPDVAHQTVTAGYGTYSDSDSIDTDTYLTAARTPDGKLVMAYMPNRRKITVDMTKLAGRAKAQWYDPTNGTYLPIGRSTLPNTGSRAFLPPVTNNAGDGDWVLVLEVQ